MAPQLLVLTEAAAAMRAILEEIGLECVRVLRPGEVPAGVEVIEVINTLPTAPPSMKGAAVGEAESPRRMATAGADD